MEHTVSAETDAAPVLITAVLPSGFEKRNSLLIGSSFMCLIQ
jgi:hypothetical protein